MSSVASTDQDVLRRVYVPLHFRLEAIDWGNRDTGPAVEALIRHQIHDSACLSIGCAGGQQGGQSHRNTDA